MRYLLKLVTLNLVLCGLFSVFSIGMAQEAEQNTSAATESHDNLHLNDLVNELETIRLNTIERFWAEMKGKCPLVEPIAEDNTHSLVTFLYRGNQDTKTVSLVGQLPTLDERPLKQLVHTDIWYRSG